MPSSLSDVARAAGVSVSVVSRVLNNNPGLRIRPETRARVQEAATRLDYAPNHAARGLRLGHTGAVGLVVPNLTNALFSELVRGAEAATERLGLTLLLGRAERLEQGEEYLRRMIREGRVDGFLLQLTDVAANGCLADAIGDSVPFVVINHRARRPGSVVMDDARGVAAATEHLIALGHTEIGYIGGLPGGFTSTQRQHGFAKAMTDAGIRQRSAWTTQLGYSSDAGRRAVREIFHGDGPWPTGLVVANAHAGFGVLTGLHELGLAVPDQVSVVALHESWMVDLTIPSLSTIEMPIFELGVSAVEQLKQRLDGAPPSDVTVSSPEPKLHHRGSSAGPSGA